MKSLLEAKKRGTAILALLLASTVLAIGLAGYALVKQRTEPDLLGTNVPRVEDPINPANSDPVHIQPNTKTFDAETFYSQVQNDMTYAQVKSLANDVAGDCGTTDVYPDSGRMGCTWSDTKHRVTVVFDQDKVAGKDKARL